MKLIKVVGLLLSLAILSCPINATTINLVAPLDDMSIKNSDTTTFGVFFDEDYYTITYQSDTLHKIELNGKESTEFNITTTHDEIMELAMNYNEMNWMQKVQFFVVRLGVPVQYLLEVNIP